ncbi:2Fe-2S iron-sulfur cluster binding domain-containing protein [Streptomyces sp. B15]|nr:2Fe-2S iron-sulfur cluster binding domain-containing protein [Streptomyces sp. RK75]MBQ1125302.1 2Fe-2S iron-sulfur cluster binding domain-containing protein [Streptomyces sp. B15]
MPVGESPMPQTQQMQQTVRVPADESLLDAPTHAGRPVVAGCREGNCGSCELTVLDGDPEHRHDIGASAGRRYACVSPRLVLDL